MKECVFLPLYSVASLKETLGFATHLEIYTTCHMHTENIQHLWYQNSTYLIYSV